FSSWPRPWRSPPCSISEPRRVFSRSTTLVWSMAAPRRRPRCRSKPCTICSRRRKPWCAPIPPSPMSALPLVHRAGMPRSIAAICSSVSSRWPNRGGLNSQAVANRLRQKTADIPGLRVFFFPMQDVRVGGRQSDSTYQFTLWDANYNELLLWAPRILAKIQTLPGLVDVSTDREQGGLQVNVSIDRIAASRLGVRVQDIAKALNDSYAQRQNSTLYTHRNTERVVLESDPQYQRDPTDLSRVYVSGAGNTQVPLSAVTNINRGLSPLVVNHQGQFPAITISFSLDENTPIEQATRMVDQAVAELHIPDTLHA